MRLKINLVHGNQKKKNSCEKFCWTEMLGFSRVIKILPQFAWTVTISDWKMYMKFDESTGSDHKPKVSWSDFCLVLALTGPQSSGCFTGKFVYNLPLKKYLTTKRPYFLSKIKKKLISDVISEIVFDLGHLQLHWRIQGGAPGTRPLGGPNSFIFMQFSAKI